jgi:O-antigen ligase
MRGTTNTGVRIIGLMSFCAFGLAVGAGSLTQPALAVGLALLPAVALAVYFPHPFVVAAVALLPFSRDVSGGQLGGVAVSASDLLLALGSLGIAVAFLGHRGPDPVSNPLRPLGVPLAIYFSALGLSVLFHPSFEGAVTFVQRLELVVVALLAGSLLARGGLLRRALTLQVVAATLLAVAAALVVIMQGTATGQILGVQKNFAAQAIAGAFLVVVSYRLVPARSAASGVLAVGLIASLSRGAIIATAAALLVVAAFQAPGRRLRLFGLVLVMGALVLITYSALPGAQQERLVQVSPDEDYGAGARVVYADDAWRTFRSAPIVGVGAGNYVGQRGDFVVTDPHNVLLLEAADGGVVLVGAFIILNACCFVILFRRIRWHPVVLTALAVQLATLLHGLVDVYWVRGTPVLGWVLVGAALALTHREETRAVVEPCERAASPGWR